MSKHTVDLPRAKKLKKLGWEKETLFRWRVFYNLKTNKPNNAEAELIYGKRKAAGIHFNYSAPIASEILEELPETNWQLYRNKKIWVLTDHTISLPVFNADTPAEALGKMYCYLKEEKLI